MYSPGANNPARESTATKPPLLDDNAGAIDNLVRYLYGFFFCDYKEDKLSEWSKNSDMLIHFSDLSVAAQKYLGPTLCEQAKITFCNLLEHATAFDARPAILASTVEHVYAKLADEATDLREPLVIHFADHVKDINESGAYKRMLFNFPEFAADVTSLLSAQKSELMSGKPGPAKKRKVVKLPSKWERCCTRVQSEFGNKRRRVC